MLNVVRGWGQRYFSDPQAILLACILAGGVLLLMWMGEILAPVIASIVIAYVLQWVANIFISWKMPKLLAVSLVYCAFLGLFLSAILILWPLIWQQLLRLYEEMPAMLVRSQQFLYLLPKEFPQWLTQETMDSWVASFIMQLKQSGKVLFALSVAQLPSVIALVIYIVLVPIMVFFFLKDHNTIVRWFANFLPQNHLVLTRVWKDMDQQMGNYIRGKVAEVLIVGFATYAVFYVFDLHYSILLAVLVGLSVLIPYVGAVVVTIPVVLVAFFQWGLQSEFAYLLLAYGIVQTLDGVILVPLLFSEIVNLHPIAIIMAVLVFGGWWGFWGVFFAIPLATLVKAVIEAWPRESLT